MKNCNPGTLGIPIFGSCIVFDSIPNLDLTVQGPLWSEPPCSRTSIPPYGWQADGLHSNGLLSCYRPQRSWGKVIFSQASVILFTGGGGFCLSAFWDTTPSRSGTPPGTRQAPPRSRAYWEIRSTSGRYASYWNAILFHRLFHCTACFTISFASSKEQHCTCNMNGSNLRTASSSLSLSEDIWKANS